MQNSEFVKTSIILCLCLILGVIPANGKVEVTVTFRPFKYDTSQVTLQVVISQFNSKPYVCTLSGSSSPHLALRYPRTILKC